MNIRSAFGCIAIPVLAVFISLSAISFSEAAEKTGKAAPTESEKLAKKLAAFESYALKAMADWRVPGMAIAIVRKDEVIYEKAFGVKELGKPDPVTVDTVFQIGSTSKAFTAALVARLVDEGKLKWDDKVSSRLPDFKMYDPWVTGEFTITDLMSQRSGMPEHAVDSLVMVGFGRDRVIDSLRYVKPVTSFRSAYAYQNNLWLVAAKIVEKITGDSWEANLEKRIFRPLGMADSSCDMKSFVKGDDVAMLHRDIDGKVVVLPMDWLYMDWVYTYGPAGGINSNVKDVTKWVRMQCALGDFDGTQIIKKDNVKYMHAPEITIDKTADDIQSYCLGWVYRQAKPYRIIWHNGGTSGSKTMIAFIPEARLGIVVLSNLIESNMPEAIAWRFFDIYFGNPERDWSKEALEAAKKEAAKEEANPPKKPIVASDALALERYTGDYSNDVYGAVTVSKKDSSLGLTVGPKKTRLWLKHWDGNKFAASWKYFGVEEDAGFVTFDVSREGVVTGMSVDFLNQDGCGVFLRSDAAANASVADQKPGTRDRLVIDGMTVTKEKVSTSQKPSAIFKTPSKEFDKLYGEVVPMNGVKHITYEQFMRLRASQENFILVDVLSSDDYNTGHIPGAISFPLKTINLYNAANKIPMGSNVVVYCLDSNCPYSADAATRLTAMGYRALAYKGGLDEWQQKGNALKR